MSEALRAGYKLTDAGVIPEDWDIKPMQEMLALKNGFAFSSEYFSNTGPIVLTPGNFRLQGGLYFESRNTKRYSSNYDQQLVFRRGELLIVMTDLTPGCNLLGKPAFVESDEIILHNQRIGKVILKSKSVDLQFLFYILLSDQYLDRIREQATGSTVRHTSSKTIYNIKVRWPTLPEQHAIATALLDIDALLAKLDTLIAKKRNIKQATMQQLLTGQTRLPGFSGEWEVKRLGEFADLLKGSGLSKGALSASGRRKCILYGELFTTYGQVIADVVGRTDSQDGRLSEAGDVLVPGSTTTEGIDLATASALLEDGIALGGDINIIRRRGKSAFDAQFLANYLTHVKKQEIAECAQGSTIVHLYGRDLSELFISRPTLVEQIGIAAVLSDMDTELASLETRRDKTHALKQGMMHELLTGKIRLVNN